MLIPSLLSLALTAYQRYLSSNGNHLFHYTLTSNFPRLHYHCIYSSLNALEFCSQCGLWVPRSEDISCIHFPSRKSSSNIL